MTSTLQQEASRKFGMGAKACMSAAQRLYEAGHITYMRTDGIDMAPEAVMAARDEIRRRFGADYVPDSPRMYKNKAKNAQEAHECIRPTDMAASPEKLRLEDDQRKLYDLIWKRTHRQPDGRGAAGTHDRRCRPAPTARSNCAPPARWSCSTASSRSTTKAATTTSDDDGARLPQIMQGEAADKRTITPEQHFTQAPPRYTEATLVKRMEELGIGRPSTYASIVTTIQDRDYVAQGQEPPDPRGQGAAGDGFPDELLPPLRRIRLHRRP